MDKTSIEELLGSKCNDLIFEIRSLRAAFKAQELLDSQTWINFENKLNEYSIKDPNDED